jgi:hypothetical protein
LHQRNFKVNVNENMISANPPLQLTPATMVDLVYVSQSNGRLDTARTPDSLVAVASAADAVHGVSGIFGGLERKPSAMAARARRKSGSVSDLH